MFHAYQKKCKYPSIIIIIIIIIFYILDCVTNFLFFLLSNIVSIVTKITKFEQEYHISNELFLSFKKKNQLLLI